jgi:hypothetical protein
MNSLGRPFGLQFLDGIGDSYEENIAKDGDYENEEKFDSPTQYNDPYAYQYESESNNDTTDESESAYAMKSSSETSNVNCCCCRNGSSYSADNGNESSSVTISTSAAQKDKGEVSDVLTDKRFLFGLGLGAFLFWGINRVFSKKDNNKKGE